MKRESKNQIAFNLELPAKLQRYPNERALRLRQVSQLTGLGRSMIYQMQAEGRFPQRIKLGERAVGWLESEVRDWLATRIEASRFNQKCELNWGATTRTGCRLTGLDPPQLRL